MEVGKRERTISSVFFRYVCFYTAGVIFFILFIFLIWYLLYAAGEILPANHMETKLNESAEEIRRASKVTGDLLPEGCLYGVYRSDGNWMYGTFSSEEMEQAWDYYMRNSIYARSGEYYRFFVRDSGEVCIAKYKIAARFRNEFLGKYLPNPDILLVLVFLTLFLIHTVLVSRHFGKYMKKRLGILNEATARIRNQDLEFEEEHSEIKEVEEVLNSLNRMKEALKESLCQQWNLEKGREEQIAALAHDIKTPLTVIRGNAELLGEGDLSGEEREYAQDILQSVTMMEEYLAILNGILTKEGREGTLEEQKTGRPSDSLADLFEEQARLLASAGQIRVNFRRTALGGEILCNENQLLRSFQNVFSNAMDYSPENGGIEVSMEMRTEDGRRYLAVTVEDEGEGFTPQDLKFASKQFYQGDQSRSSKAHYGLGLYTAERFAKAQGGRLEIGNAGTRGGRVTIFILTN